MSEKPSKQNFWSRIGLALRGRRGGALPGRDERVKVRIPVEVASAAGVELARTGNMSIFGLVVEAQTIPAAGSQVALLLSGPPEDPSPIRVLAHVLWTALQGQKGMGLQIDTRATPEEQIGRYQALVAYYLRHDQRRAASAS